MTSRGSGLDMTRQVPADLVNEKASISVAMLLRLA